ncbi:carbohydrate ABC transporter permease [Tersicoccus sp. MR15.9]|uniref:carbohydrate ABC transporter permease n=1 Tax=Tersicoccus mangrovi TaxID=3121635 RepID=UPI002FE50965
MSTATATPPNSHRPVRNETAVQAGAEHRKPLRPARVVLHVFLIVCAVLWLIPLLWALYTSLRPYAETATKGYVSLPTTLTLQNYITAWTQGQMPRFFLNSLIIAVPAVVIVLLLSSAAAFVLSRFSFALNIGLLMLFTAANLLPQQVIITPLYRLFLTLGIYNTQAGIVLINVAFQMGFCVFVLSNFMRALPHELTEAALVDGASVWRQYTSVILPLTRPALAALATLEFAWIYNDFFWALVLLRDGSLMPVTTALNNLKGNFFTDNNLIAAGAILVALPTVLIYVLLQKHFVSGLTLGANK